MCATVDRLFWRDKCLIVGLGIERTDRGFVDASRLGLCDGSIKLCRDLAFRCGYRAAYAAGASAAKSAKNQVRRRTFADFFVRDLTTDADVRRQTFGDFLQTFFSSTKSDTGCCSTCHRLAADSTKDVVVSACQKLAGDAVTYGGYHALKHGTVFRCFVCDNLTGFFFRHAPIDHGFVVRADFE